MSDETKMRAYLVSRTGVVRYDEFDAFVVVAHDPDDARKVAVEHFAIDGDAVPEWYRFEADAFAVADVTEIDLTRRGEVLGSFNAG